jgi:arsenate reductase-like glutaredoxin family protein
VQSTGKDPIEGRDALRLLDGVRHLHVAKGRKVEHFDLRGDRPDDDALLSMMLGRSGKLRAPVVRSGDTLVVGYNAEVLATALL